MNLLDTNYFHQNNLDLFTIATDVQKLIMEFLQPEEIKELFETCVETKIMFKELTKHTNLVVNCKRIITNEELQFFESQNIQLKLLETYELKNGTQFWYKNGVIHRDNDKPAIINSDGAQYWYQNGRIHRDNDLPAIIFPSGSQHWCKNGLCHRDNDLPAIIYTNGSKGWYKNGNLHREDDLPAMIGNGEEYWFKEGRLHRDNNLPALTRPNGTQLYFKYGVRYIPVTIQ